MEYYLENDQLSIRVSSFGGELQSMMDKKIRGNTCGREIPVSGKKKPRICFPILPD